MKAWWLYERDLKTETGLETRVQKKKRGFEKTEESELGIEGEAGGLKRVLRMNFL